MPSSGWERVIFSEILKFWYFRDKNFSSFCRISRILRMGRRKYLGTIREGIGWFWGSFVPDSVKVWIISASQIPILQWQKFFKFSSVPENLHNGEAEKLRKNWSYNSSYLEKFGSKLKGFNRAVLKLHVTYSNILNSLNPNFSNFPPPPPSPAKPPKSCENFQKKFHSIQVCRNFKFREMSLSSLEVT